jgi:hypothetical protein
VGEAAAADVAVSEAGKPHPALEVVVLGPSTGLD